jgi:CheY-like chemotaxis protein
MGSLVQSSDRDEAALAIEPGCRVFLVEDEAVIAMLVEDMLRDLGCEVVAVAARLDEALHYAASGIFDLAILDVNLDGARSYPAADVLLARGVPIVFATGYGASDCDQGYAGAPLLQKPFLQADLAVVVSRVLSGRSV